MQDSLLIELLTEELPPKSLLKLSQAFAKGIFEELQGQGFVADGAAYAAAVSAFATPRRLAVLIKAVAGQQSERTVERKGPALNAAFDKDGKPTPALTGFAKSCGVAIENLEKQSDKKGEYFIFRAKQPGEDLEKHLSGIVAGVIKKLPVAKLMRWGESDVQFVRPVHGLIMLHGSKIVPGEVLGLTSKSKTLGHRFLSEGEIELRHTADYKRTLLEQGKVMVSHVDRQESVAGQLDVAAQRFGDDVTWTVGDNIQLLAEVASLVEYPTVYVGGFNAAYLEVPQECLIVSMQQHQRYFPLRQAGKLLPNFLFVSNNQADNPAHIIHGNERVLNARLADAKFFFEQDQKTQLEARVPRLVSVVYHNKLGSQLQRVERIQKLAIAIAERFNKINRVADIKQVERAAYLCKADLLTDMVGEFPELQGIMGYYYALHDGEELGVANAIREHYERVPRSAVGICVGLADKLDTLVGIYGIGLVPTGDKDPFGLRRQALSILRTLITNKLSLNLIQLLEIAEAQFLPGTLADDTVPRLYEFMLERLKPYLRELDFTPDEIDAVLSLKLTRMDGVVPRLEALQQFRKLPEAESLAAANKRIRNILRQAKHETGDTVDEKLLTEQSEINLAHHVQTSAQEVTPLLHHEEYAQALARLATLRPAVDEFFDQVMVMADDAALRKNRLALLNKLSELFMHVADLSKLQS